MVADKAVLKHDSDTAWPEYEHSCIGKAAQKKKSLQLSRLLIRRANSCAAGLSSTEQGRKFNLI